jgi:hypothetical protein
MSDISRRQAVKLGLATAMAGAFPSALRSCGPTVSGTPGRSRAGALPSG